MSSEPFGTWLLKQTGRNDPVGDLARDFRHEGGQGLSLHQMKVRLSAARAGSGAWRAMDEAEEEWLDQ